MFGSLQLILEWRVHFNGLSQLKYLLSCGLYGAFLQITTEKLYRL